MAGSSDSDILHRQDFLDESGWTSLEPEGAGHHPHEGDWHGFPDAASGERWETDAAEDALYIPFDTPAAEPAGTPPSSQTSGGPADVAPAAPEATAAPERSRDADMQTYGADHTEDSDIGWVADGANDDFGLPHASDRWEGRTDTDMGAEAPANPIPGGSRHEDPLGRNDPKRGRLPVEGDGDGAPE